VYIVDLGASCSPKSSLLSHSHQSHYFPSPPFLSSAKRPSSRCILSRFELPKALRRNPRLQAQPSQHSHASAALFTTDVVRPHGTPTLAVTRRARKIRSIVPTVGMMGTRSIIASGYRTKRRRPLKLRKLQLQPQLHPPSQPPAKHYLPTLMLMIQQLQQILQKPAPLELK